MFITSLLRLAKRAFRRVVPRKFEPALDGAIDVVPRDGAYAAAYDAYVRTGVDSSDFVARRYAEGQRWRTLLSRYVRGGRVLDVGGADGAIELAFAADPRWFSVSVEYTWNDTLRRLRAVTAAPVRRVVADAARMPFRDGVFDAATCFDTLEHFHDVGAVGEEVARVSAANGIFLVTTPPRLRYVLRPDPHFEIRGLLALPSSMQRRVAARRGFTRPDHFVDRIYWSIPQLRRALRRFRVRDVVSRSRAPRRLFWDAVVFQRDSK